MAFVEQTYHLWVHLLMNKLVQHLQEVRRTDEEERCLQALRTTNYEDQKNTNTNRAKGTCLWCLEDALFLNWRDRLTSRLLWITADPVLTAEPGCGKSVLSKALVDENLLGQQENDTVVCYFFFKDTSPEQRSPVSALSALLHQLFASRQGSHLIKHALPHFRKDKDRFATNLETLWTVVQSIIEDPEHPRIILLLDALDECRSDSQQTLIMQLKRFEKMQALGRNGANTFQFIITSRPYWDIEREFQELIQAMPNIRLPAEDKSKSLRLEINCVIEARLNELERSSVITSATARNMLRDGLSNVENRTYLWIHIIFAGLEKEPRLDVRTIQKFLNELPTSVEDAYEAILRRSNEPEDAKRLLHIILAATRPLSPKEIAVALYITDEVHSHDDLEIQEDSQLKITLRCLCGLFVSIVDGKVFLIHQTAKEFLLSRAGSVATSGCWRQSLESRVSNVILARCCLLYLQFDEFKLLKFEADLTGYGHYSAQNWPTHIQEAREIDDATKRMCLNVCDVRSNLFRLWSGIRRFDQQFTGNYDWSQLTRLTSRTHYSHVLFVLVVFGLDLLIAEVLNHGEDVDISDMYGTTSLSLAAGLGHETVVRLLLHKQADINSHDQRGNTPLLYAVIYSRVTVVKLLLDKGADVNIQDIDGMTALMLAVQASSDLTRYEPYQGTDTHEEVVKLLLDQGADVTMQNKGGKTALILAIIYGRNRLTKVLLDKQSDMDPGRKRSVERGLRKTSIRSILRNRCTSANAFKSRGLDLTDPNNGFWGSALQAAASVGNESVVELLLKEGAEVNNKEGEHSGALQAALRHKSKKIAHLLLSRFGDDLSSDHGPTLLQWAVEHSDARSVELLLTLDNIDVDFEDNDGRTSLSWAAEFGYVDTVEALLRKNASIDLEDINGRTPSSWAVEFGRQEIVEILYNAGNLRRREDAEAAEDAIFGDIIRYTGPETKIHT
ncbi:ankyrin repeat domain-containing protein [Rutstroemia sp. NJR-2017a BBW]|nr:ankyrin repeat domain-containing protein [Rutstroemia sp. NJR-2017a BBW]